MQPIETPPPQCPLIKFQNQGISRLIDKVWTCVNTCIYVYLYCIGHTSDRCKSQLRLLQARAAACGLSGNVRRHIARMVQFKGCGFLCVCYLEAILYCWEFGSCPLSEIKKRPLLGGCLSVITMVISIRNTECVRCREIARFSEGPRDTHIMPA